MINKGSTDFNSLSLSVFNLSGNDILKGTAEFREFLHLIY